MSNPLPLVLLASLVAGGAGAAATTILTSKPDASAQTTGVTADSSELLAKLDSMESNYNDLLDRISTLEDDAQLAPIGAPERISATASEAEIEEVVREVLAGPAAASALTTPELDRRLEAVIEMREERRSQERKAERAAAAEKRMEDRLAKLQSDLGLDQNQVNGMRTIYQDQEIARGELRDKVQEMRDNGTGSREEMRDMFRGLTDTTNEAIQGVLTPSQYETYQESNNNDRGGRGGNNGGGGRGGNNGGGGGGRGGR